MVLIDIPFKTKLYITRNSNPNFKRKKIECLLKFKISSNNIKKFNSLTSKIKSNKITYIIMNLFTIILLL